MLFKAAKLCLIESSHLPSTDTIHVLETLLCRQDTQRALGVTFYIQTHVRNGLSNIKFSGHLNMRKAACEKGWLTL